MSRDGSKILVFPRTAMERATRERVARLRTLNGKALRERTLDCIAGDVTHPPRFYGRLFRICKARRVAYEAARHALIRPLEEGLAAEYGVHLTGEYDSVA